MPAPVAPAVVVHVTAAEMAANFVGAYAAGVAYARNQWVSAEEGLYACLKAAVGHAPTSGVSNEYWAFLGALPS